MSKTLLVTGGAGFIGSHTTVELLDAGHDVVVVDNLCNSSLESLSRVERITGRKPAFFEADLRDEAALAQLLKTRPVDAVIHFAGLKAVGESVNEPLAYYDNNVSGTLCLLRAMRAAGCRNLVFSSSATVYGDPARVPITEDMPLSATNPYGRTKLFIEEICGDLARAEPDWHVALLRYFNPVGAHPSGLIGEDPRGTPNNLMPYLLQVAIGRRPHLNVFGNDWPTPDGTGVRDFIHVVDLARGHLLAVDALPRIAGAVPINLGTGRGHSVLEMVVAVERASGRRIPYRIAPRRRGDVAVCYADASFARKLIGFATERGLEQMCADAWRWQEMNPNGFG